MKTKQTISERQQVNELIGGLKRMMGGDEQGKEQRRQDIAAKRTVDQFTAQWINNAKNDPSTTPDELVNYARYIAKVEPGSFTGNPTDPKQVTQYLTQALAKGRKARLSISPPPVGNTAPSGSGTTTTPPTTTRPVGNTAPTGTTTTPPTTTRPVGNTAPTGTTTTPPATTAATGNLMPAQQISAWISRNSEDATALKSFLDGIAAAGPSATKKRTGGKVPGQVSQTPNAIRQRDARAAKKAANQAGAGAFGQMAAQLTQQPTTAAPKFGPGVSPQTTIAPSKVTYKIPTATKPPANKPVQTASKQNNKRPL